MKLSELFVTVKESRDDTEYDMMNNMSKDERDWWDKMDATTKRFARMYREADMRVKYAMSYAADAKKKGWSAEKVRADIEKNHSALNEERDDDIIAKLADDIKFNWMSMDEDELFDFLKENFSPEWMKYLQGLSDEELKDTIEQAYYLARNA